MTSEIRALSVRQPWAWGICAGVKKTENRTWSTAHRGTIAIHASTSAEVVNRIRKETGCFAMSRDHFAFGAIIGLADVVNVASYGRQHETDPFAEGPYCWAMENGRFLREPIPLPGKLNLFKLSREVQDQLWAAETWQLDLEADLHAKEIAAAITVAPDPVASYLELVEEYWRNGNHRDAMENAGSRLVELVDDNAVGYMIQADLRLKDPDASDCSALLEKAVAMAPDDSFAWYLLTNAYLKERRLDEAKRTAGQLVKIAPDDDLSYQTRARVYYQAKQFPLAIADLDYALQLVPDSAFLRGARAETKLASGDLKGARADIAEARRMDPDDRTLLEIEREIDGTS